MGIKKKTAAILVRLDESEKKALEKEAETEKRTLANYVRYLLMTHQHRQKKGKS